MVGWMNDGWADGWDDVCHEWTDGWMNKLMDERTRID